VLPVFLFAGILAAGAALVLAMASALTDMDSAGTAKTRAGMKKILTDDGLRRAVMGVIEEE